MNVNACVSGCFRAYLEKVLYETMLEMRQSGTFRTLTDAVRKEKDEKSNMEAIIRK